MYDDLQQILGYKFQNQKLLEEAMTHPSMSNGRPPLPNYQRLEFLGDSVLSVCVAEILFLHFPDEKEGVLSKKKSLLISTDVLSKIGKDMGIGKFIVMSRGEEIGDGRNNPKNIENVMEAILGAMYIDGGLEPPRTFIIKNWTPFIDLKDLMFNDVKSILQEWFVRRLGHLPTYRIVNKAGSKNRPIFTAEVEMEEKTFSDTGESVKKAEKNVARKLILYIKENMDEKII